MITAKMVSGELFPNIIDETARSHILRNILSINGRIPSIYTFLEDTKYLEPCAIVMKTLLPPKSKRSIAQELTDCHSVGSRNSLQSACRQLWIYCIRHFPRLQHINPRKDPGMPKPNCSIAQHMLLKLASLAYDLGFRTVQISSLLEQDPLESLVRTFVHSARPCDKFEYDLSTLNAGVRSMCDLLRSMTERTDHRRTSSMVSDRSLPLHYRCGRPFESSFLADESSLDIHNVYGIEGEQVGQGLSNLGIKVDIFRCFFNFDDPIAPVTAEPTASMRPRLASSLYSLDNGISVESDPGDSTPSPRIYSPASMDFSPSTRTTAAASATILSEPEGLENDALGPLVPQGIREASLGGSTVCFFNLDHDQLYTIMPEAGFDDALVDVVRHYQRSGNYLLTLEGTCFVALPLCTADDPLINCPLYIVATKGSEHSIATPAVTLLLERLYPADSVSSTLDNWPFG